MILVGTNIKFSNVLITFTLIFVSYFTFSQSDTTVFNEVTVKGKHQKIEKYTTIDKSEIDQLAPQDLGSLLQYINGITIKNYGGIGGMKTLSHRGLGGEHTQLVIDGKPMSNPQNGQVNLANIQLNNVEEVSLSHQNTNQLIPVSGLVKGSSIQLKTFDQQFSPYKLSIRSNITFGSFGQKEGYLALKNGGDNSFISLSGGFRSYQGNYPYELEIGNITQEAIRRNNALEDYHFTFGTGLKWNRGANRHILKLSGRRSVIDQELPGAVILYNNLAQETLRTENSSAGIDYGIYNQKIVFKSFAQYSNRFLHYHDPTYLNSAGFLDNQYTNQSIIGGFHLKYSWQNFTFHAGNDIEYDNLKSSRNLGQPQRITNTGMIKSKFTTKRFYIEGSLFSQSFIDENPADFHRKKYSEIHPQISLFTSDELFKNLQISAWYKASSRAPSFNELYYSQIGNKLLNPEESSQLNLSVRFIKNSKKMDYQIQGNLFRNLVRNKILALPTQNLFVWSVQNIGKVDIYGGDIHFNFAFKISEKWQAKLQSGFSYQQALDISDVNSPTYRHQIAYTPTMTGNAIASLQYKKTGITLNSLYIGERYSLNENVLGNRLTPYYLFDFSVHHVFKINKKQQIKLQAGIKNISNASYNFIKYYVMPGRNYFIKLNYALN